MSGPSQANPQEPNSEPHRRRHGPELSIRKHVASGDTAVLEVETEMGGKYVNGVEFIRVNGAGEIDAVVKEEAPS